jgi:23S rRNA (guanosine2251-2'-O)-methyltransferase
VRELLAAGRRRVKEVLFAADLDPAPILDDIAELADARRVPLRQIGRTKFDATAVTSSSQGVLARAQPLPEADLEELARLRRPPAFLVVVEGVTDPQNLGALVRTAECAGVNGLVLPRHRAVHITPTVTKTAAGAVEYLPLAIVGGIPSALSRLDELEVTTVGLDADGTTSLFDLPLGDVPVALVLGAEGDGLSRLARQRCSVMASLPLAGQLNSLNVAAAGAVACFEVARQRRSAAKG